MHDSYRGARLTDAGWKIAVEMIRHHRLIETYLVQALGYAPLVWFTARRRLMGALTNRSITTVLAVVVVAIIVALNIAMVGQLLLG